MFTEPYGAGERTLEKLVRKLLKLYIMDKGVNLKMVDRSNILVREESDPSVTSGGTDPLVAEKPGIQAPIKKVIIANVIPVLKALVIITLFLLNGVGFSPLGCRTQYLLSSRFWYNKQIVIFFIIYFIVNLGGDTISKLTDPIQQLITSIVTLLLYNVIARLGAVWWDKDPWYWPGPMTWFGLISLPLIIMFILDDMRRYYMAENAIFVNADLIDNIKYVELGVIGAVLITIVVGLMKAIEEAKKRYGKYYSFLAFFFGVPMGRGDDGKIVECNEKAFRRIKKEIKLGSLKKKTTDFKITKIWLNFSVPTLLAIILGYFSIYRNYPAKIWSMFKNEYRNAAMAKGGIN